MRTARHPPLGLRAKWDLPLRAAIVDGRGPDRRSTGVMRLSQPKARQPALHELPNTVFLLRTDCEKLKSYAFTRGHTNDGAVDLNGRFIIVDLKPKLEGSAFMHEYGALDATALD